MRLREARLPRPRVKDGKIQEMIESFIVSGKECMEIEEWQSHYQSVGSAIGVFNTVIRRYEIKNVRGCIRKGHIYLIRTDRALNTLSK